MINPEKLISAVEEYFEIRAEQIQSRARNRGLSYPRKIIAYALKDMQLHYAVKITGRSPETLRQWIGQMSVWLDHDPQVKKDYESIMQLIESNMTIKLNLSQLHSLYIILSDFTSKRTDDVALKLLSLHMDDIKEKIRKNIRNDKPNLKLDQKQGCAFMVWHLSFSQYYQVGNPHGYMTILDVINQLKPIQNAKQVPD